VSCCCENLVVEAGDSSGTQRNGNICATSSENVAVDASVCVRACEVTDL
jgi:hypothetical protein